MARYASREGRWYGRERRNLPLPEDVRDEREFHTDMGNGMLRVDIGAPVARLPSEPQPVAVKGQPKAQPTPEPTPASDLSPLLPADLRRVPRDPREFKPALGRG